MSQSKSASFVLELKLKTSGSDAAYIDKCMGYGCRIYNTLGRHCRKQVASLRQDGRYRALLGAYASEKDSRARKRLSKELSGITAAYGLTEYSLHAYVSVQQKVFRKYINSHVAQKIASSVWRGVEKVLYHNGKRLHFKKLSNFTSLEGKNNTTGIVFRGGDVLFGGRKIQARRHKRDGSAARHYEDEALKRRVKYCRLIRRPMGDGYQYYVQLILEGSPPVKHQLGHGRAGLDIGTSTAAAVTDTGCILTLLGKGVADIEKRTRRIQRKMDRSRRAMNPGNYNPDGTVKRGRRKWVYSSHYRKLNGRMQALCRKRAAALKQEQEILADKIAGQCDTLYVEKMNFKGLQRKSRKTELRADGRYKRRKRFGKSLQVRAPSQFCRILKCKIGRLGGRYLEVNTVTFKASQYDHTTDTYTKKKLSRRHNVIDGRWVQRDLYSAFLLKNSDDALSHPDRQMCMDTYEAFLKAHDACIEQIRSSEMKIPRSFGFTAA